MSENQGHYYMKEVLLIVTGERTLSKKNNYGGS